MARQAKKPSPSSTLRIIGGQWRGRKLSFTPVEGLRPTTDRVRETVFNWLQFEIAGARCLDLFAGSGALGLEALSREATLCSFVELNGEVCRQLRSNLAELNSTAGEVHNQAAEAWLQQAAGQPYHLVFLDPPFRQDQLQQICQQLEDSGLLADDATLYIEAEREWQLALPSNWKLRKEKHAGQLSYRLFDRQS